MDHKKAECQRIDAFELVLENKLKNPVNCKEIKPVNLKENQPRIFTERTEAEATILWPPDAIGGGADSLEKTLMLGKIEGRRRRGQQSMRWLVGWHHQLNEHEFEQVPGVSDGQGSLVCCSTWGHKKLDTTEQLN